jgi:hypothetical protein
MRRIGVYKELSRREAHAEHLSLSLDGRLRRSRVRRDDAQDDPTPFYDRARQLGLYEPYAK